MNIKPYVLLALLLSVAVRAEYIAQKDGIKVKVVMCMPQDLVVSTQGRNITTAQFISSGLKPLWLEVTNESDRALELSKHSVNLDLLSNVEVMRPFTYRTIMRPVLTWLGISMGLSAPTGIEGVILGYKKGKIMKRYAEQLKLLEQEAQAKAQRLYASEKTKNSKLTKAEFETQWPKTAECKALIESERGKEVDRLAAEINGMPVLLTALQKKYATYILWSNRIGWLNFFAIVPHHMLLARYNKELDVEISKQLLYDSTTIAPGQTVKKLLIVNAKTSTDFFALSIRDPRTQLIKAQFNVVLQ